MDTFSKFPTLPSEQRSHALSYLTSNTLVQYAQCSKLCSAEVQKQYIGDLKDVKIREGEDEINILFLSRKKKGYYRLQFMYAGHDSYFLDSNDSLELSICKGNYRQAAAEYVTSRLKYNWKGCPSLTTDVTNFWPFNLKEMRRIEKSGYWTIRLHRPLSQELYDLIKEDQFENVIFYLENRSKFPLNMPSGFFKSPFFQSLAAFSCSTLLPEFDANEFLTMKAAFFRIDCSLFSDEVINQKLCQIFDNPTPGKQITCFLFRTNGLKFDKSAVLKNIHFSLINLKETDGKVVEFFSLRKNSVEATCVYQDHRISIFISK